jgi:anti-anti-sigma factor
MVDSPSVRASADRSGYVEADVADDQVGVDDTEPVDIPTRWEGCSERPRDHHVARDRAARSAEMIDGSPVGESLSRIGDVDVRRPNHRTAIVELHGEHDLQTAVQFRDLLSCLVDEVALLVVDVSDAQFIDSSVLHNLVHARRLAIERGSRLLLHRGTASNVRRALEISGIANALECVPDRDEALALHEQEFTDVPGYYLG